MRTPTLFLSSILFGTVPLLATDRVVSASATYNTISSAIAASSDGDRILVDPGTYVGNIRIDKSLTVLCNSEGARFFLTGAVQVVGAGIPRRVLISGIHAESLTTLEGTERLDVVVVDSYLTFANGFNYDVNGKHRIELYRDSLPSGAVFRSGAVIGCTVGGSITVSQSMINVMGTTTLTDPISIIGNELLYTGGYSMNTAYAIQITANTGFRIENNYVNVWGSNSKFLGIDGTPPFGQPTSTVCNNVFRRFLGSSAQATITGTSSAITVNVSNNAIVGQTGPVIDWPNRSGATTNNLNTSDTSFNTTTGQPVGGSPLLNAGDPDPRYLDLDLTTNDVGCYGGSNSRANFTTGMGSAVVGFMQAPRVVAQGEAVNINAVGFDR